MIKKKFLVGIVLWIGVVSCENKLENSWQSQPHINAFNEAEGVELYIKGERLSEGLNEAMVSFSLNQDLISGGFKQIFTFTLNGTSAWDEDYIEVFTPTGESFQFEIYDGLLFNIDYESNVVSQFIELLNNEYLEIHSGQYRFTISNREFMNLYSTNFLQPTS